MSEATWQMGVTLCACGELVCRRCFDEHKGHVSSKYERVMHLRDKHADDYQANEQRYSDEQMAEFKRQFDENLHSTFS